MVRLHASICDDCIAIRELGYYVSSMDILGRWACCLANIPNRIGPMGSTARNHHQVSLLVSINLHQLYSCLSCISVRVSVVLLGPFHGAVAVPSVTHCCCRRHCRHCGHRCAGGVRQYSGDTW